MFFSLSGEQLVWKQAHPLQEEHRQGPGRGQHVRREGRRRRRDPRGVTGTYDEPWEPVGRKPVFRGRACVWWILTVFRNCNETER